ncbi:hypothetical protein L596_030543 [Steinernema carpocapsae]|uniref:Uncharacterized protein n=1 Tax=Steinernema carpocapsae TaxID=34508 RepID=A0A4U5LPR6_STECR|nr:hypothetical protein L596_030543 [Steinernema carpocapsae]
MVLSKAAKEAFKAKMKKRMEEAGQTEEYQINSFELVHPKVREEFPFTDLRVMFIPKGPKIQFAFLNKYREQCLAINLNLMGGLLTVFLPDLTVLDERSIGGQLKEGESGLLHCRVSQGNAFSIEVNNIMVTSISSLKLGNLKDITSCKCSSQSVHIVEALPSIVVDDVFDR